MAFLPYDGDPSVEIFDKLAPPFFNTTAGIPLGLTILSIVGFSSRAVLILRCCMFPAHCALCPHEH